MISLVPDHLHSSFLYHSSPAYPSIALAPLYPFLLPKRIIAQVFYPVRLPALVVAFCLKPFRSHSSIYSCFSKFSFLPPSFAILVPEIWLPHLPSQFA